MMCVVARYALLITVSYCSFRDTPIFLAGVMTGVTVALYTSIITASYILTHDTPICLAGVMAGMAVALLVVAFTIGVVATYMFYRRRGGAFLPKKFDNTDITQDDS